VLRGFTETTQAREMGAGLWPPIGNKPSLGNLWQRSFAGLVEGVSDFMTDFLIGNF
jgi:hypothetical protein